LFLGFFFFFDGSRVLASRIDFCPLTPSPFCVWLANGELSFQRSSSGVNQTILRLVGPMGADQVRSNSFLRPMAISHSGWVPGEHVFLETGHFPPLPCSFSVMAQVPGPGSPKRSPSQRCPCLVNWSSPSAGFVPLTDAEVGRSLSDSLLVWVERPRNVSNVSFCV